MTFLDDPQRSVARVFARQHLNKLHSSTVALGRTTFERGLVRSCKLERQNLWAQVASSESRSMRAVVGRLGHLVRCTCSWGGGCKHVAAVLWHLVGPELEGGSDVDREAAEPADREQEDVDYEALRWARGLGRRSMLSDTERVVFLLDPDMVPLLRLGSQKLLSSGKLGKLVRLGRERADAVASGHAGCVEVADVVETIPWVDGAARLRGRSGGRALALALDSGRLYLDDESYSEYHPVGPTSAERAPLVRGPALQGRLGWSFEHDRHRPVVDVGRGGLTLMPLVPLHYFDARANVIGAVEVEAGDDLALKWLTGPSVSSSSVMSVARAIAETEPRAPVPLAVSAEVIEGPPRGVLTIKEGPAFYPNAPPHRFGELAFRYGDVIVKGRETQVMASATRQVTIRRDPAAEARLRDVLRAHGFTATVEAGSAGPWRLGPESVWLEFLYEGHRALADAGFDLEIDPSVSLTVIEADAWYTDLESSDRDWFELSLGAEVDGQRVSLLPALLEVLRGRNFVGDESLLSRTLFVELPDGRHAVVPRERVEPLAEILLELAAEPGTSRPRLSRVRAMDLAATVRAEQGTLAALRKLRDGLIGEPRRRLTLPKAFRAELRPYQRAGVQWLVQLQRAGLGAVLADDMGLGKTVQIIALLALAKHEKERDKAPAEQPLPSLVVAPTSVLLSWLEQLARFAPHLDVVLWHGGDRGRERSRLTTADVVLTSYALLHRDAAELVETRAWNLCVIDEAQMIKNAKTVLAERVRELDARQRIVLTGTPIENHLGELWSIVSSALPGAFGSERAFRAAYRNPIEKQGSSHALESLRRRLAPVLLRRTKEQVAPELPAKTVIDHVVEIEGAQRDIYEAVRQTMVRAVREEIERKGFARARIMVLDALLKLRQVCCDPRLLKAKTAKRTASAKLEAFADLIEPLAGEGRRTLVFSQFVGMLELIGARLDAMKIPYLTLTGATRDRGAVVDMFRKGTVPVFLISLKAGGTGLNLVEADTVIHYDPWWNPAVEAQATDRAHRIGQDKPVFVHRLLTKDTVEAKIVELQASKARLATGLLEGRFERATLDEATVDALLAPLPG